MCSIRMTIRKIVAPTLLGFVFALRLVQADEPKPVAPPAVINLPSRVSVGGGWSEAGPKAEYIVGQDMKGKVAFTRKEVRVDFNWGTLPPVGGSTAEPYKSFPHDNISVRFTGKVIPRFTESYTFTVRADSDVTLSFKDATGALKNLPLSPAPAGHSTHFTGEKVLCSKPVSLQSGTTCDLVLEYHHKTGPASCVLSWFSPSTPEEVIDPVIEQGLNLTSYIAYCWASDSKTRRWGGKDDFDEKGDLKNAAGDYLFAEGSVGANGTYSLVFNGKADVTIRLCKGKFIVNGQELPALTAGGPGYDAAKNETRALFQCDSDEGTFYLTFKNAARDSAGTTPGVTNLRIMHPTEAGSNQPCAEDAISYPPMARMATYFTAVRWLQIANSTFTGHWADRTKPDETWFSRPDLGLPAPDPVGQGGETLEYLIMFANETGRDLYLTTPMLADDDYFRKLAQLLRYGSDGVNPYTQPTANPKYPPLNSNLRVYFEVGNEIWNWAFASTQDCKKAAEAAIAGGTDEGKIINYDGKGDYRRFHAVRTVKASNIFREVFGDEAMEPRVRPLIEFQYTNAQNTAAISYGFLDNYYNNGDGDHVKDPHPVRYYVWGGGGAAYYGVGNGDGTQTDILFKDASFEEPILADGVKSSDSGTWTFTGMTGRYRGLSSAVTSYVPSPDKDITQPAKSGVGISFHTGAKPLWVYQLGRVYTSANDKGAKISILRAADKGVVTSGMTGSSAAFVERPTGYYWADLPDKKAVQLAPNTDYWLVSQDVGGSSRLSDDKTTIQPGGELSNVKAIKVAMGDPDKTDTWTVTEGDANHCAGPVTMLYSTSGTITTDYPQPPDGQQAAFLNGTGEISQDVNFPKAGSYAVTLNATRIGKPYGIKLQMFCDDQNVSPSNQQNFRVKPDAAFNAGGFARNLGFKEEWGSSVITIDQPGPHKIRLVGTTKATDGSSTFLFDNLRITSADALLDSGFGTGSALGQPAEAAYGDGQMKSSQYAWSFGLPRVSYETGWSVGGDFGQKPIQNWCKFMDLRVGTINDKAIDLLIKTGMYLPVWGVYIYFPYDDIVHGETYPVMKSFITASDKLPVEVTNGVPVPAALIRDNCVEWGNGSRKNGLSAPGTWASWTIICPATGIYDVTVANQAAGKIKLEVDGVLLGASGPGTDPSKYRVKMTKGIHGVRVADLEGTLEVPQVNIDPSVAK